MNRKNTDLVNQILKVSEEINKKTERGCISEVIFTGESHRAKQTMQNVCKKYNKTLVPIDAMNGVYKVSDEV